jgi:hypothetical protein
MCTLKISKVEGGRWEEEEGGWRQRCRRSNNMRCPPCSQVSFVGRGFRMGIVGEREKACLLGRSRHTHTHMYAYRKTKHSFNTRQ